MYSGKTVLVTGDSRGIGEQIRNHFLQQGAYVYGCSRSSVVLEHDRYRHIALDLTSEQHVVAMMRTIRQEQQRLDIVVNNAGTGLMNHALLTPSSSVEQLLSTNVTATFTVCREAAKIMKHVRFGRIINLVSVAVPLCLEGEAAYAASKSAVIIFSKIFAREVAPFGITCNCLGPSPVPTDLTRSVPEEAMQKLLERLPLKCSATFDDIVNVIDFFASGRSSNITGQVVYLGGA